MKLPALLATAALVSTLAACGQPATDTASTTTATTAAAAAPSDLKGRVEAMSAMDQPGFAWQQLLAYQHAHPEATPPCQSVRQAESLGVVPANVQPNSIYAPHAGQLVFSVQCGPQLTTVRADPHEHWLIAFASGAAESAVQNCADAHGKDQCFQPIPLAAAATP